jgi:hypothetical protein
MYLDPQGRSLATHSGYLTADQLLTMLSKPPVAGGPGADLEAQIAAVGRSLAAATQPADRRGAVLPVVEEIANPQPGQRTAYLAGLHALGPPLWEGLVECLSDDRPAIRAAAAEVLATVSGGDVPFDAFAVGDQRRQQVEAWRRWVRENKGRPTSRPVTELRVPGILRPAPAPRPATAPADQL